MMRKSTTTVFKIGVVAFFLFAFLFADGVLFSSAGFTGSADRKIAAIFHDPEEERIVFICLWLYSIASFFLLLRMEGNFTRLKFKEAKPSRSVVFILFIFAIFYTINYKPYTDALILIGGPILGLWAALWAQFEVRRRTEKPVHRGAEAGITIIIISMLVTLLVMASVWNWNGNSGRFFGYHGHVRWVGLLDNPNSFGLMMGTGIVLAVGQAVQRLRSKAQNFGPEVVRQRVSFAVLFFLAALLMGRGLVHSYSRGAWCATGCALIYLTWRAGIWQQGAESGEPGLQWISWLKRNELLLSVILLSIVILCFWQFRQAEWHLMRRALSAVNPVDFSWRNRVAAWEGALQITAEHPLFGTNWSQPESLYEHLYLVPRLSESVAIEMNDYLMLGATLGFPALGCFAMYVWMTLGRKAEIEKSGKLETDICELDWLQTTCHAGAIVLLVGFWFDGGLFKLPTAATFWILLELGAVPPQNYLTAKNAENTEIKTAII